MKINELLKALRCSESTEDAENMGCCTNENCKYCDVDGACNITSMCEDAANYIKSLSAEIERLKAFLKLKCEHESWAVQCISGVETCLELNSIEDAKKVIDSWRKNERNEKMGKTINIKCIYCFQYRITCKGKPKGCDKGPK